MAEEKLIDLVKNAETREDIEAIWESEQYKRASGIEVILANQILGTRYLKLRLDDIESRLIEIERKVGRK